jgi:hypothetical protein
MNEIKKYTCKCESCNRKFDEKEFQITKNENKCILHCEKNDWYEVDDNGNKNWDKSKNNITIFWSIFEDNPDIENLIVPPIQNNKFKCFDIHIENSHVLDDLIFRGGYNLNKISLFDTIIDGKIDIITALSKNSSVFIVGIENLSSLNIRGLQQSSLCISNSKIKKVDLSSGEKNQFANNFDEIEINNSEIRNLKINNSIVHNKVKIINNKFRFLNLNNCDFKEKVELKMNDILYGTFLKNTNFFKLCDLYMSKFNYISFEKTSFKDISVFTESIFNKSVNFKYTTFEKLSIFRNSKFKKLINLKDTIFKEKANFLNMKSSDKKDIQSKNIANRETARIIKDSFEQQINFMLWK